MVSRGDVSRARNAVSAGTGGTALCDGGGEPRVARHYKRNKIAFEAYGGALAARRRGATRRGVEQSPYRAHLARRSRARLALSRAIEIGRGGVNRADNIAPSGK